MWESGALGFFFFYGEALPGLCMYISGLFPFPLFYFNFSKCLTDVSSLVSLFFSFFVSLVNSVWPKLQDVWWISYAKPHHHHWTRHNVTVILLRYLSHPSISRLLRLLFLLSLSCARPRPARRHPKSPPWPDASGFYYYFLPMKCFVPEVLITCLQKEKQKQQKTYCKPIAMHLTETGGSSSCPTFRVIPNHHGGATGSHAVTIKPSSLLSRSLSQLTIRWLLSAF